MSQARLLTITWTFVAGLAGALAFLAAGLPAPWLSGAMVGVVILIAGGIRVDLPGPLCDLGLLFAGVAMGSAITPEMIQSMGRYPLSLLLLVLTLICIVLVGRFVLMRFFRWPADVALFGSLPGAMSAVLATTAAAGVDMSRVAVVQAFRMFVLVAILPSFVTASVSIGRPAAASEISVTGFAIVMALALLIAFSFERAKVLAPFMFGGMAAGGATHATGLIAGMPPSVVVDLAMFLIGVFAGTRIAGITLGALRAMLVPSVVSFIATMFVTAIGASLAVIFAGASTAEALIAFAPGGLEAMIVLGMALGLDPLYLSSHHVARFALIAFALPFLARRIVK